MDKHWLLYHANIYLPNIFTTSTFFLNPALILFVTIPLWDSYPQGFAKATPCKQIYYKTIIIITTKKINIIALLGQK
jgi:hypothetical protein